MEVKLSRGPFSRLQVADLAAVEEGRAAELHPRLHPAVAGALAELYRAAPRMWLAQRDSCSWAQNCRGQAPQPVQRAGLRGHPRRASTTTSRDAQDVQVVGPVALHDDDGPAASVRRLRAHDDVDDLAPELRAPTARGPVRARPQPGRTGGPPARRTLRAPRRRAHARREPPAQPGERPSPPASSELTEPKATTPTDRQRGGSTPTRPKPPGRATSARDRGWPPAPLPSSTHSQVTKMKTASPQYHREPSG